MNFHCYLKPYLRSAIDGSIKREDLSRFIQLARSIIEGYLLHLRSSLNYLCAHHGMTATDISYECVEEVFRKDNENRYRNIKHFIESLDHDLEQMVDSELLLAFRSFLTRIADAQLARLYALADPAGAHIHRNIRLSVKTSNLLSLDKTFHGLALRPIGCSSLEHLPAFPFDELERHFHSVSGNLFTIPELLKVFHEILVGQADYRRVTLLVDVVQLFKRYYASAAPHDVEEQEQLVLENIPDFEIEEICLQVEAALKERIIITYLSKGKLQRDEAEAVFKAFHDMLLDWRTSGNSAPSLYDYLHPHLGIDEDLFESNVRVKMSYLLKFVKEEFKMRLLRDI